ncbi:MAG: alpha/beta fold hydrolase [Gemmatimonadota bacterium]
MSGKTLRKYAAMATLLFLGSPLQAQDTGHVFGWFPVNSTQLYYEMAGAGSAVVLLHGGWLNSRQWDEQFSALSRKYKVVRYDVRGAGRSAIGDSAYASYEDLAALLNGLGIDRAHLVGLSAGGQLAIDFALAYPHAVRSLVIGASPLRGYDLGKEFADGMRGVISAGVADDLQLTHDRMWAFPPFQVASTMPRVRRLLNEMILHPNSWSANRPNAPRRKQVDPRCRRRWRDVSVEKRGGVRRKIDSRRKIDNGRECGALCEPRTAGAVQQDHPRLARVR